MSKYVNRQKRKARSIDQILELIKQDRVDDVYEEYVFQFGKDYLIQEYSALESKLFNQRFKYFGYDLVKKRLLK